MEDDNFKNIMDMNEKFGRFAIVLHEAKLPVWTMNMVPILRHCTLKIF